MGPNEMHPRVPREWADVAAPPLFMLFKNSWQSDEPPGDWRKGNIAPMFQKDRKEDLGNYQPVSLTPVPGKVMECRGPPRSCDKAHKRQGYDP